MSAFRSGLLICTLILPLAHLSSAAAQAVAAPRPSATLNISPRPLVDALNQLAHEMGLQLLLEADETIQSRTVQRLVGTYTADAALAELLVDSGLHYEFINEHTVAVRAVKRSGAGSKPAADASAGTRNLLRLAAADEPVAPAEASASAPDNVVLEQIVVTAQKQGEERLQDVPIPMTAINNQTLVASNQLRLEDFYTRIPGFNFVLSSGDRSTPAIAIRGVTTGGVAIPTVGVVFDDVPYGGSTSDGGLYVPHIDPSDLSRIEVLRGPQGSLYGASSMGGLVRYVTTDPSTYAMSGRLEAGLLAVERGSQGHNLRGAANIPASNELAFRVSAYSGQDPGYVDNIGYPGNFPGIRRDVNDTRRRGGRFSALWVASDAFSVKLNTLIQDTEEHGSSMASVEPGLKDLQQRQLLGSGKFAQQSQLHALTLNGRIRGFDITSITGYSTKESVSSLDSSSSAFFSAYALRQFGATGVAVPDGNETRKRSEELRVSTDLGERLKWLLGAFYTDEKTRVDFSFDAVDVASGAVAGSFYLIDSATRFEEYAAFTNLTVEVNERLDIQVGGRQTRYRQTFSGVFSGPYAADFLGANPTLQPAVPSDGTASTYLLAPRYRISPDLMMYARLASGYRPGGPNVSCPSSEIIPCEYGADETRSYEAGFKGSWLDRALTLDVSVYYIDWDDIQLSLTEEPRLLPYNANAGRARSQGMELALAANPRRGLSLSAWVAYNDAELTDDPPSGAFSVAANIRAGDRLPYSSRLSGNLTIDQKFPITTRLIGHIGGSVSYVDDRQGNFPGYFSAAVQRQTFPAYWQTDLRGGFELDSWSLNLFVNNIADERGVLSGGAEKSNPFFFSFIRPRMVGLTLIKTFN
jgi:iron complex outermembrane recepter protein